MIWDGRLVMISHSDELPVLAARPYYLPNTSCSSISLAVTLRTYIWSSDVCHLCLALHNISTDHRVLLTPSVVTQMVKCLREVTFRKSLRLECHIWQFIREKKSFQWVFRRCTSRRSVWVSPAAEALKYCTVILFFIFFETTPTYTDHYNKRT